jgi:TPR repeat protein
VARAAATVWKRLYGSWPASIQFAGTSPQEKSASEKADNNPQSITEGGSPRNLRRSIAIVASCLVLVAAGFWKGPAALEELANRLAKRSQAPSFTSALYGAACQLERFSACGALARRYESGVGVSKDPDYALALLKKACLKGSSFDCLALIEKRKEQVGIDVDTTLSSALAEVQKKCDSGEVGQCEILGLLYFSGVTGASEPARAAKIYGELCKLPEAKGCSFLAFFLDNGLGVTEDKVRAVELYDRACKHDHFDSCISLGLKHLNGEGVEKDKSRALTLFEAACNAGVGKGCAMVAAAYVVDTGADYAKVRTMMTRACELDFAEGCLFLGGMYLGGLGGPKDNMRGVAFFEKACELGDPKPASSLGLVTRRATQNMGSRSIRRAHFNSGRGHVKSAMRKYVRL